MVLLLACILSLMLSDALVLNAFEFKAQKHVVNQEGKASNAYDRIFGYKETMQESSDINKEPEIYNNFLLADDDDWEDVHQDYLREEASRQNRDAQIALGNFLYENDEIAEAEATFKQAAEESAIACFNLALLYHKQGLLDKAETYYMRALLIEDYTDYTPYQTYINLGVIYYHKGDFDEAESYFKEAVKYDDPYDFQSLSNLALVYGKRSDIANYNQLMERAILKSNYVRLRNVMDALDESELEESIPDEMYEIIHKEVSKLFVECKKRLEKPFDIVNSDEKVSNE